MADRQASFRAVAPCPAGRRPARPLRLGGRRRHLEHRRTVRLHRPLDLPLQHILGFNGRWQGQRLQVERVRILVHQGRQAIDEAAKPLALALAGPDARPAVAPAPPGPSRMVIVLALLALALSHHIGLRAVGRIRLHPQTFRGGHPRILGDNEVECAVVLHRLRHGLVQLNGAGRRLRRKLLGEALVPHQVARRGFALIECGPHGGRRRRASWLHVLDLLLLQVLHREEGLVLRDDRAPHVVAERAGSPTGSSSCEER
mmetsp:Transcript_16161/g.50778  ORF Transcript_16161/g.50778 Transcript_16161/m.50778 type:complete len:258 (-) Transcript_16161:54-827(-)